MSDIGPPHDLRPPPVPPPGEPPLPPPQRPPPPQRNGCLAAITVIVGLILLLPGLCALLFSYGTISSLRFDQLWNMLPIVIVALVLAGFGIWLIRKAAS